MSRHPRLENPVQMAVIGAPHGISGEVRVKTFTGDPTALGDYGPLQAEDGRIFTITSVRPAKDVIIVRFGEVKDRTAAEALTGLALYVDRSSLPTDLEDDEYYHADLIGLLVIDETGEKIGKVAAIHDFGAGTIIEISLPAGRSVMVPFTRAAVPEIDLAEGMVRVDSLAAGLDEETESEARRSGEEHHFDPASRPRGPSAAGGNR